jgi:hypothetical protein
MRGDAPFCLLLLLAVACSSNSVSGPSDATADDVTIRPSPTGYPCGPTASPTYCFAATYCLQSTLAGQIVSGSCQDLTPACPPGGDADVPDCTCVERSVGLSGCTCAASSGELVLTCPLQEAGIIEAGLDASVDAAADAGPDAAPDSASESSVEAGAAVDAGAEAGSEAGPDAPTD